MAPGPDLGPVREDVGVVKRSKNLVVGFDLDMTLVDPRSGVHTTLLVLSSETGVFIDADLVITRLGPPLEDEMAQWFPAELVEKASDRYRQLFEVHGLQGAQPMPGARAALNAVAAAQGCSIVVTARYEPHARALLTATGLMVDQVIGWRFGPKKGEALLEHGAAVFVGDSPPDIEGARIAGAIGVGVPSGPHGEAELGAAGADVVLASLEEFPDWFWGWLRSRGV